MTGEGITGLGPTFCGDCKSRPATEIDGKKHPICKGHQTWLENFFKEHPERKIGWSEGWDDRTYGWVEEVRETRDNEGTPGDHDKPYTYYTPAQLHARGALSAMGALKMHRLKDTSPGLRNRSYAKEVEWPV